MTVYLQSDFSEYLRKLRLDCVFLFVCFFRYNCVCFDPLWNRFGGNKTYFLMIAK